MKPFILLLACIAAFTSFISCRKNISSIKAIDYSDSLWLAGVPSQPGMESWHFIEDLKSPMWTKHQWEDRSPGKNYSDLSEGINLSANFPDPEGRLVTAWEDLKAFLRAGDISSTNGSFQVETVSSPDLEGEAFILEIGRQSCRIKAGDTEGIRRGIFYLEDEMLRNRGPFIQMGTVKREPLVRRRISRCVYGPIKRPPAMRDELLDTIDYYPDNYLNRLSHEGVNGLWLSVDFRDLVRTKYNPSAGRDADKRLEKLWRTVNQCLRYGIHIYIFTIEPRAWGNQPPYYQDIDVLKDYPELGGVRKYNSVYFCPFSETAQNYLYEVVNTIFREVPGLGGMINISHGERATTCLSAVPAGTPYEGQIDCPRCSGKQPWEILYASLSAMERGMHDAAPDAELISWHYAGGSLAGWVYEIPAHTPEGVILQFQFETGVTKTEFGKKLTGGDYWLSTPGPSENFRKQALIAREHGTPVSAKIQTGNSHEVASIPFVPVPSMIYRKFSAMHQLDVSHSMLGWYFGNYPGLMIKSAGELSFSPFPESEDVFLHRLASVYWKPEDVPEVVKAWKYLAEGYGHYPLQNMLGYYGPMHDGPVWPLLLKPLDAPLTPTWQVGSSSTRKPWPPSGDRIGECLWYGGERVGISMDNILTLKETVELCQKMSSTWDKGTGILEKLESLYRNEPERLLDIGLAKALSIQFRSGYNILRFYMLREEMFRMDGTERLEILKELADIIKEELAMDEQLILLCNKDSRLGFHSEAEGYKYFPAKIKWRMEQLRYVLDNDFPEVRKMILDDELLFPEYTGKKLQGQVAYAGSIQGSYMQETGAELFNKMNWSEFKYGRNIPSARWAAAFNADTLYIIVSDTLEKSSGARESMITSVTVKVEPRRLWPSAHFFYPSSGSNQADDRTRIITTSTNRYIIMCIPFERFWWRDESPHPVRIDVQIYKSGIGTGTWCSINPITSRLVFGTQNSADLGWLMLEEITQ